MGKTVFITIDLSLYCTVYVRSLSAMNATRQHQEKTGRQAALCSFRAGIIA